MILFLENPNEKECLGAVLSDRGIHILPGMPIDRSPLRKPSALELQ